MLFSRWIHNHRNCFLARGVLAVLLIATLAVSSCNTMSREYDIPPPPRDMVDDDFALGAHRPPTAKTLYALARILAAQGRHNESQFVFLRIMAEHPDFVPVYNELAELNLRTGRLDNALKVINAGLELAPEDPILINNLGLCWLMKKDYEKALEQFEAASAILPYIAKYRANIAVVKGMTGLYDECLAEYELIVPEEDAHYNLAVICESIGDHERAAIEYEHASRIRHEKDPYAANR